MPVSQRLEVGRRPAGSTEEIVCDPVADLWVRIAAIPRQDGMLMVGG
jgi:hypothetical protein